MGTFDKLAIKIQDDLGLIVDRTSLKRTYAGINMRSAGAFLWKCKLLNNPSVVVGSCERATDLVNSKNKLVAEFNEWNEIEIFID